MPVDRSSMPAERLKNTATIIEHNIYLGTPTGLASHQSTQRTLKAPYIRIRVIRSQSKSRVHSLLECRRVGQVNVERILFANSEHPTLPRLHQFQTYESTVSKLKRYSFSVLKTLRLKPLTDLPIGL